MNNVNEISLYHIDIGFPTNQKLPKGKYLFSKYSQHALDEVKDRYGDIDLPRPCIVDFDNALIFEIGIADNKLVKVGCRVSYDNKYDISYILSLSENKVITVWLNNKEDTHKTLDYSRYCKP